MSQRIRRSHKVELQYGSMNIQMQFLKAGIVTIPMSNTNIAVCTGGKEVKLHSKNTKQAVTLTLSLDIELRLSIESFNFALLNRFLVHQMLFMCLLTIFAKRYMSSLLCPGSDYVSPTRAARGRRTCSREALCAPERRRPEHASSRDRRPRRSCATWTSGRRSSARKST